MGRKCRADEPEQPLWTLLERLYDAVSDLERWPAFLAGAAALFAARGAQIGHSDLLSSRLSFSIVHGYDWSPAHMQHYERLMGEDPRIPYFSANPFRPVHCRMALSDEQLRRSRVYQEVLAVGGVEYSLGVNLVEDRRTLTYFLVLRDRSQAPFTERDCELMGRLVPHLRRALTLQGELGRMALERRAALDALDGIATAILVVDGEARVRVSNEAARRMLAARDGIGLAGERLLLEGEGEPLAARARRLLAGARSGVAPAAETFRVHRPSGAESYLGLISCLGSRDAGFGWSLREEPLAIVHLRDPEEPDESRAELLQRLYGLLPCQARLADLLATGCSLKEAARQLELTPASARQYLKLVSQKMGTHRQTDLVRKVLQTPLPGAAGGARAAALPPSSPVSGRAGAWTPAVGRRAATPGFGSPA